MLVEFQRITPDKDKLENQKKLVLKKGAEIKSAASLWTN